MYKYIQSVAELKKLGSFCEQLYGGLEKLCKDVQKSRLNYSAQRIKLMTFFHQQKSTDLLKMWKELWTELSSTSEQIGSNKCPSLEPVFVQHCCSAMMESTVKKVFPTEAGPQSERQLTGDQQCALRYVSGYILQKLILRRKLSQSVSKCIIEMRLSLHLMIYHVKTQLDLQMRLS